MLIQYKLAQLSPDKREEYLKKYGDRLVHIHSDNGFWRSNAKGYTGKSDEAWLLPMREAYEHTSHCGPEKAVRFVYPIETIERLRLACEEEATGNFSTNDVLDQQYVEYSDES